MLEEILRWASVSLLAAALLAGAPVSAAPAGEDPATAGVAEPGTEEPATQVPGSGEPGTGESAADEPAADSAETEPQEPGAGTPEKPADEVSWLDWMQRGMHRTVTGAARWFDGFFGNARFDQETESTYGRLSIDTLREGEDDPDVDVDFRVRVAMPNLDRRIDALFGRETEEGLLSEPGGFEPPPSAFRDRTEDRDWLLGLGYRPVSGSSRRLSFQVGVRLRFPLDPFVQTRYRRHFPLGELALVRLRETVFWRGEDGLGFTSSLDLERILGTRFLIRWGSSATLHERSEGAAWRSGVTLFQSLGHGRAMAYHTGIDGETDAVVPLRRYEVRATYRQSVLREWLFGEVTTGLSWPRYELAEVRDAELLVGFGFEIQFGERP